MTPEQMREMAAKKAEEWIIADNRLERRLQPNSHRWTAGIAQNYTAQEIADAIRALPLEAGK